MDRLEGIYSVAQLFWYQVRSLQVSRGDFDWAGTAHMFPVVLVLGAATNADLVGSPVGRFTGPQELVGTAMQ